MNKKLLAVAIGAALSAPMLAQADVKVTGTLNVSADYLDTRTYAGTDTYKVWNVSSNASFFKIEASEDLGGGMKGIAAIQEFVRMDNTAGSNAAATSLYNYTWYRYVNNKNTNRLFDGEAYLGLSAGFGTVLLGSLDSPAKKLGRSVDLFSNQIGDSRNLDVNNNRFQNTVAYQSPKMAGVSFELQHSTNLDNSANGNNTYWWGTGSIPTQSTANSIGVKFEMGTLMVGAAYEVATPVGNYTGAGFSGGREDEKWTNLAASYGIGPAKIVALYSKHENVGQLVTPNMDKTTYGIGGSFAFGNETVKLQYYKVQDDDVLGAPTNSGDAKMIAVGYDHAFSKTFTGYVAYAQTENDANKSYSMAAGGHGDQPSTFAGESMAGLSIGAIMKF